MGYVAHDNQHRPHRALGQAPPQGAVPPPAPAADVRVLRVDRLGGLIHEYIYVRSPDVDEFSAPTGALAQRVYIHQLPQTAPDWPNCSRTYTAQQHGCGRGWVRCLSRSEEVWPSKPPWVDGSYRSPPILGACR